VAINPSKVINYRALGGRPRGYDPRLRKPPTAVETRAIPIASTMLASMTPLLPTITTAPTMPPWGLLVLLGWRLLDRDVWPVWMALPLGLFDDMFSGQPMGSSMMLWTLAFLVIEVFDRRMIWRDYKEDWTIAAGLITAVLTGGLIIAGATGGSTGWHYIAPQIGMSIMSFPIVVRFCALIDRMRRRL
jgi:rod shape-determining protein MreD